MTGLTTKSQRDLDEILMMVQAGISIVDAAEEVGISASRAYQLLELQTTLKKEREERDQQIITIYTTNTSCPVSELAESYDMTPANVYRILKAHNIPRTRGKGLKGVGVALDLQTHMCEAYQKGMKVTDICRTFNRSLPYLYYCLHKHNIPLRGRSGPKSPKSRKVVETATTIALDIPDDPKAPQPIPITNDLLPIVTFPPIQARLVLIVPSAEKGRVECDKAPKKIEPSVD